MDLLRTGRLYKSRRTLGLHLSNARLEPATSVSCLLLTMFLLRMKDLRVG